MIKRFHRASDIRFKLVVGLLAIVFLMGILTIILGLNVINTNIIREANETVQSSLAATNFLYQEEILKRSRIIEYLAKTSEIVEATAARDRTFLFNKLVQIKDELQFDIVNLVDPEGRVLVRANAFEEHGDSIAHYRYIGYVIENRRPVYGTGLLEAESIRREGPELAERTIIKVIPTPHAPARSSTVEDRGLVIKIAAPVMAGRRMIGILYAAILLNNNDRFIDRFKRLVFREETFRGKDVGTTTIFLGDVRIATNVFDREGRRAIGTQVSEEVYRKVYERGETWQGAAFVVDSWYLSGYSPVYDVTGRRIGMLYVGILKAKYDRLLRRTGLLFLAIVLLTTLVALAVAAYLIGTITRPVNRIIAASGEIAGGRYTKLEGHPDDDEDARKIGEAFNRMVAAVEERDLRLQELTERTILKSEKLASIGRMASGVAHEINNPLTGILTYSSLLLEELAGTPHEEDLRVIRDETLRCRKIVRGLLDFARETTPQKVPADVNALVDESLRILEKQASFQNVTIVRRFDRSLPPILLDVDQFKSVLNNLAVNAADAMPSGGRLTIATERDDAAGELVLRVADTGIGIGPENMAKLFEPFFTTKEPGKGTGLGLAVTYGVIKRHGGTVDVKSKVGEGTEFTIRLPLETETERTSAP